MQCPEKLKGSHDLNIPLLGARPETSIKMNIGSAEKLTVSSPGRLRRELNRAWLFIAEPDFVRYQGGMHVPKTARPQQDIFSGVHTLVFITHIPGTKEKAIQVDISGDVLRLQADAFTKCGQERYYKEVLLPFEVDTYNISYYFKDGILQLELNRITKVEGVKND